MFELSYINSKGKRIVKRFTKADAMARVWAAIEAKRKNKQKVV